MKYIDLEKWLGKRVLIPENDVMILVRPNGEGYIVDIVTKYMMSDEKGRNASIIFSVNIGTKEKLDEILNDLGGQNGRIIKKA
uniref:Uncharacterized protein n=1 Tax=viral metagenome TaxID=1070528 RepID=A0A6M3MC49_9ZZZZ